MSPRHSPTRDRARPDLAAPPPDPTDAIAWAVLQRPDGWEIGEWLARLIPDGSWDLIDPEDLADQIVGAAVRGRGEEAPK